MWQYDFLFFFFFLPKPSIFFFTARSKKYAMTCLFHTRLDFCHGKRTNFARVVVWVKSWMKRIVTLYNWGFAAQVFVVYGGLPVTSPPRNDLATNVLATKRSHLATNHQ